MNLEKVLVMKESFVSMPQSRGKNMILIKKPLMVSILYRNAGMVTVLQCSIALI